MMGLMWFLLIVLIIAAIIVKIKRSARVVVFKQDDERMRMNHHYSNHRVGGLRDSSAEQMVSCAKCGVYVPASEVFFRGGKVYCCEEHSIN